MQAFAVWGDINHECANKTPFYTDPSEVLLSFSLKVSVG